jgi:SNF2 family DNA or RNA helicase
MSSSNTDNAFELAKTTMSRTRFTLKDFQETGVRWMIDTELNSTYKGGILADDPGLGKTIQTAGLLAGIPKGNTLIIVPTSVIHQWVNTLSEIFGRNQVYLHYGSRKCKSKAKLIVKMSKKTICVTSHGACFTPSAKKGSIEEILEKDDINSIKTVLHTFMWDRVVVDEAHVLRNKSTKIHKAVRLLNWSQCNMWGLTGTPVQNSENDMVGLACFVGLPIKLAYSALEQFIETYVKRRTKQILIDNNELDDYEVVNHQVPFTTSEEQEVYEYIERDAISEMVRITEETDDVSALNMMYMELLLRLRQTVSHPSVVISAFKKKYEDFDFETEFNTNTISSKIGALVDKIKNTKGYCLVFAHFRKEMQLVGKFLDKEGIQSEIYDGSLNLEQRQDVINKFDGVSVKKCLVTRNGKRMCVENKPRVLLIQIKAGGVGLNLQQFTNVFILSPDWNPANEIQAIARAHRLGQKETVTVHKFTVVYNELFNEMKQIENPENPQQEENNNNVDPIKPKTTVEERILCVQKKKRSLMVRMLNDETLEFNETFKMNGKKIGNKLTHQDMKYLISGVPQ